MRAVGVTDYGGPDALELVHICFDLVGVGLSGQGVFLIVFALQQGQSASWAPWIWVLIIVGVGLMAVFVYWQSINATEPLLPLAIFRDRSFAISTLGMAVGSVASTASVVPVMFFAQEVCGLSPTRSALLTAPIAIVAALLAPVIGNNMDRIHPRWVIGLAFSLLAIALTWLSIEMTQLHRSGGWCRRSPRWASRWLACGPR